MQVDPKRVQAVFLAAVEQQKPVPIAHAVLDRECGTDRGAAATGSVAPAGQRRARRLP